MMHAIRQDVGPLSRDQRGRIAQTCYDQMTGQYKGWTTWCNKTAEEVEGHACYPSAFVDCPDCIKALDER